MSGIDALLAALPLGDVALGAVAAALGLVVGVGLAVTIRRARGDRRTAPSGRVLLALAGPEMSCAAVDAAARIGRADDAVVVPAVLVATPYHLPLDRPLPEAASEALDLLDAVEQRLQRAGVEVDARMVQGRTRRHALRRLVAEERFDRLVVPAARDPHPAGQDGSGFSADDVAWLLAHVDGEVLVLRPSTVRA
ncbi:hypothetical protein [Patulibacter defluvii]|uniref:hypothetical protein n=1 Tax=Patulibacter defluvii TaxID=3095358 RepID=UPI002A759EA5|nr:hypothetical protein [Patulibacter sp. DM4]